MSKQKKDYADKIGEIKKSPSPLYKTFAERILTQLDEKGMTQGDLAEATGISKGSISGYVKGTMLPNAEYLFAIADTFQVSCDYLLGRTHTASIDTEDIAISKALGLDTFAIEKLRDWQKQPDRIHIKKLNKLLRLPEFSLFLHDAEDSNKKIEYRSTHHFSNDFFDSQRFRDNIKTFLIQLNITKLAELLKEDETNI